MENIDYYKELLDILSHHSIRKLPSKLVISSSEEIALVCWKNFLIDNEDNAIDYKQWYNTANWANLLEAYKENIAFWEKAFTKRELRCKYSLLLLKEFANDFPYIANHYLGNNESLFQLFIESEDKSFFDLIEADKPEKKYLYKQ